MPRLRNWKQVTHIAIVLLEIRWAMQSTYLLSRNIDGQYIKEGVIFSDVTTEEIVAIAEILASPYEALVVDLGLLENGGFSGDIDSPFIFEIPQIIAAARIA